MINEIALDQISWHPKNPRDEIGDVSDLKASIPKVGLLQPIIITGTAAWLAANPQDAEALDSRPWVVLAGHRRLAAALELEMLSLPAIIREDLSDPVSSAATFLHENLPRKDFSPLEEARGFQLLIDLGRSQRDIANDYGRAQSHISKRLALLGLSPALQDEIRAGRLSLVNANVLASAVPREDQDTVYEIARDRQIAIEQAHRLLTRERESERVTAEAIATAAAEGISLVDPTTAFTEAAAHRLYEPQAIADAKAVGDLVAQATPRGLEYYTRTLPTSAEQPAQPAGQESSVRESAPPPADAPAPDPRRAERERRAASKRRIEVAEKLVQSLPAAGTVRADLARGVLRGTEMAAVKIAHQWLGSSFGVRTANAAEWRDSIMNTSHEVHAAWAIALAGWEVSTRGAHDQWPALAVEWVQRLQNEAGYKPTEWEQHCINTSDSSRITHSPDETQVPT
ncbi:ParB/RepB/Spo0J family partition protein [Kribbella sp. NPDC048928]|uniref:ParB/RepB/Spo0J family partition protein n=1 Tax=Kribbella sp. NPDC048928 TaxID=3364111 RepID=UPI0037170F5B